MSVPVDVHIERVAGLVSVTGAIGFNAVAWLQSASAGTIASTLTIVGFALIGVVGQAIRKIGPAMVDLRAYHEQKWVEVDKARAAAMAQPYVDEINRLLEEIRQLSRNCGVECPRQAPEPPRGE